jgi:hypothetical protein
MKLLKWQCTAAQAFHHWQFPECLRSYEDSLPLNATCCELATSRGLPPTVNADNLLCDSRRRSSAIKEIATTENAFALKIDLAFP